jgi:hypothetical protein
VAVAYEDVATRDFALQLCDSLSQKFRNDLEFEFTWWGFKYLTEPEIAQQAAEAAAKADLIIVCVNRAGNFPAEVEQWFKEWSSERLLTEGALVVVEASGDAAEALASQHEALRSLAQRANLDYLAIPLPNRTPPSNELKKLPETSGETDFNWFGERFHSSGWGINE